MIEPNDIVANGVRTAARNAETARRTMPFHTRDTEQFSAMLAPAALANGPPRQTQATPSRSTRHASAVGQAAREAPADSAYRQLGGVLLQKTFETMLPNLGATVSGNSAASFWKSMLAQQLADSVSATLFHQPDARSPSRASPAPDEPASLSKEGF